MAKTTKLLLLENVDTLGIVGDVVNVRLGYARNFLLPRSLATTPSDELIQQLATKRADAQKQLAALRKQREDLIGKLQGVEIELTKSVNDQGILYGAITQQELASALVEKGFSVKPREVRLTEVIKRIGNYEVHVKLDSDLDSVIKLHIKPDRELDLSKGRGEDEEGEKKKGADGKADANADAKGEAKPEGRGERGDRGDREERRPRRERPERGDFMKNLAAESDVKPGTWGAVPGAAKASSEPAADKPAKKEKADKGAEKGEKKAKKSKE